MNREHNVLNICYLYLGGEGLVEDVILLGAPVSGDPKNWEPLIKVVGGKIVNGYARYVHNKNILHKYS